MMRRRTFTRAMMASIPLTVFGTAALAQGTPASGSLADKLARVRESIGGSTLRMSPVGERLHKAVRDASPIDDRVLLGAIDPTQYECEKSKMSGWIQDRLRDFTAEERSLLFDAGIMDWPTYYALLFEPVNANTYYGLHGEYTKELVKTFRNLKSFWDVDGSAIVMAAMHAASFQDIDRMPAMVAMLYEMPEAQARRLVLNVSALVLEPKFKDHPIFTFNAFAYQAEPEDEELGIGDKIIMGDGIMEAMESLGYGDVAPRGILAHEYGHQVQYRLGRFEGHRRNAEDTRETELEADAFAAYYLSHPRGERLRNKRVVAYLMVDREVGDCSFTSNGHHGTPNQRERAGRWADELANAKGKKGHILTARTVSDAFLANFAGIVKPDA